MKRAPEGATHFSPYNDDFYKVDGQKYLYFIYGRSEWSIGDVIAPPSWIEQLVLVPKQPKPWSGPEDGLPPIGSVCEVENPLEDGQWCKVKILAWDAECAVFQAEADYPYVYDGQGIEGFRPLRTPEQQRETAIRELMDIAQVDCRVTAARLVDAGFKREVV